MSIFEKFDFLSFLVKNGLFLRKIFQVFGDSEAAMAQKFKWFVSLERTQKVSPGAGGQNLETTYTILSSQKLTIFGGSDHMKNPQKWDFAQI